MASFSVYCSFTFHNFAWSVMEKKAFHKPPQALARKRYAAVYAKLGEFNKLKRHLDIKDNKKNERN